MRTSYLSTHFLQRGLTLYRLETADKFLMSEWYKFFTPRRCYFFLYLYSDIKNWVLEENFSPVVQLIINTNIKTRNCWIIRSGTGPCEWFLEFGDKKKCVLSVLSSPQQALSPIMFSVASDYWSWGNSLHYLTYDIGTYFVILWPKGNIFPIQRYVSYWYWRETRHHRPKRSGEGLSIIDHLFFVKIHATAFHLGNRSILGLNTASYV